MNYEKLLYQMYTIEEKLLEEFIETLQKDLDCNKEYAIQFFNDYFNYEFDIIKKEDGEYYITFTPSFKTPQEILELRKGGIE